MMVHIIKPYDGTYYQNKVVNITRICEVKRGYTRMFGKEKEEQPA
jgi:hypothetical protein